MFDYIIVHQPYEFQRAKNNTYQIDLVNGQSDVNKIFSLGDVHYLQPINSEFSSLRHEDLLNYLSSECKREFTYNGVTLTDQASLEYLKLSISRWLSDDCFYDANDRLRLSKARGDGISQTVLKVKSAKPTADAGYNIYKKRGIDMLATDEEKTK